MALLFYDQTNRALYDDFKGYMGGAASWNHADAVGAANEVSTYATQRNNEADITDMLKSGASRFPMSTVVYENVTLKTKLTLYQAVISTDEKVVVLKGIHQKSNPHLTVAYGTQLYHLKLQVLGSDQTKFGIKSMSAGENYEQLGWKVQK
jgi:hypothetical protein